MEMFLKTVQYENCVSLKGPKIHVFEIAIQVPSDTLMKIKDLSAQYVDIKIFSLKV